MTDPTPLPGLDEPATVETEQGRPRVVCRICRRPLTGPARARGTAPHPGRFDIDQEQLPGL